MKFTRISPEELRRYAPLASDFYLNLVATYLEAGGLFPGWLGKNHILYVYDASLDPEDYFGSYREISFDEAVNEAIDTCDCFVSHWQKRMVNTRTRSLEYARCLQELGRLKGDMMVLKTKDYLKNVG